MHVVNKRKYAPEPGERFHYIGRPSVLGNKWSHRADTKAEFVVSSREEAVRTYELWLRKQIDSGDLEVLKALEVIQEGDALVCWCSPALCHGDAIIKVLRQLRAESQEK
jgi:hypothetical protein